MRIQTRVAALTLFSSLAAGLAHAQNLDACKYVLELTGSNLAQASMAQETKFAEADALCSAAAGDKGSSSYQNASAGFSTFSAKYGAGKMSYDSFRSMHCQNSESTFFGKSQASMYSRQISTQALVQWGECIRNLARGVQVNYSVAPGNTGVNIVIRYTGGTSTKLLSLTPSDKSNTTCVEYPSERPVSEAIQAGIDITPNASSFSCTRKVDKDENVDIVTAASDGPYTIRFIAAPKAPTPDAMAIMREYADRIAALEARLTSVSVDAYAKILELELRESVRGIFQVSTAGSCLISNVYTGNCACPSGYTARDAGRGAQDATIRYCTRDGSK